VLLGRSMRAPGAEQTAALLSFLGEEKKKKKFCSVFLFLPFIWYFQEAPEIPSLALGVARLGLTPRPRVPRLLAHQKPEQRAFALLFQHPADGWGENLPL